MTCSFGKKISRRGNTHEFFAPVSVYPTSDGYVYIAVGNDKQFQAFSSLSEFSTLAEDSYRKNAGRIADVDNINKTISEVTRKMTTNEVVGLMGTIGVAASKINTVTDVARDPLVSGKLIKARDEKSGFELTLAPPPAPARFLEENQQRLSFPPRFGEHNEAIYGAELGVSSDELAVLKAEGII
jgi:crotonobetainyl-CoA:carnitine CoA-transferase CaiB-like acyl-CoA transferase